MRLVSSPHLGGEDEVEGGATKIWAGEEQNGYLNFADSAILTTIRVDQGWCLSAAALLPS